MDAPGIPVFRLKDATYRYPGGLCALDRVSLEVRAGESVALLGANGSGKSTLLRMLDGLFFPESGTVEAFGAPLAPGDLDDAGFVADFRRRVALVFQNPDVQLFCPTVREEVAFGPLQLGLSPGDAARRVDDLLDRFGLAALGDRGPHLLSGGEKKRVAIAAALATGPDVLLMDEPFEGLDPRSQALLVEFLHEFQHAGRTVVSATHDLSIVDEIARRVVIFSEDHRIAADGPSARVLADQELLLRVNLIHVHGHVHGEGDRHEHPHAHGHGHHHHGDHTH